MKNYMLFLLSLLFPFCGICQEVRTFYSGKAFDMTVPAGTTSILVELWGPGGNGNQYGGGDGGDFLKIKLTGKSFKLNQGLVGTAGYNTWISLTKDGKEIRLEALAGNEKTNTVIGNSVPDITNYTTSPFDDYMKGAWGTPRNIINNTDNTNTQSRRWVLITENCGDGGNSYWPVETKGRGCTMNGTIVKPNFGAWQLTDTVISYIFPTDGRTPGGGGGGGSAFYTNPLAKNLFGRGGDGLIRLTFSQ